MDSDTDSFREALLERAHMSTRWSMGLSVVAGVGGGLGEVMSIGRRLKSMALAALGLVVVSQNLIRWTQQEFSSTQRIVYRTVTSGKGVLTWRMCGEVSLQIEGGGLLLGGIVGFGVKGGLGEQDDVE
ncbi:hypothetical protein Tco_0747862 [Tanacetum coccineum]|uniref:Uncharacterized protein n=1 Tax=Tanacetum coccineum TaxID=301880 RepID=A0ABQ4YUV6_9ASTR